jgi:hypothetical protein
MLPFAIDVVSTKLKSVEVLSFSNMSMNAGPSHASKVLLPVVIVATSIDNS